MVWAGFGEAQAQFGPGLILPETYFVIMTIMVYAALFCKLWNNNIFLWKSKKNHTMLRGLRFMTWSKLLHNLMIKHIAKTKCDVRLELTGCYSGMVATPWTWRIFLNSFCLKTSHRNKSKTREQAATTVNKCPFLYCNPMGMRGVMSVWAVSIF